MINFTGLLKITNVSGTKTYLNTDTIEKIEGNDKKTTIVHSSGLYDTFERSVDAVAKDYADVEETEIREVPQEIETPFV